MVRWHIIHAAGVFERFVVSQNPVFRALSPSTQAAAPAKVPIV